MPTFADSPKNLTPRQQRFVAAYITCGNASKAAHEAGYRDAKNEGHRLVHRPHIQAAIQKRMQEVLQSQGRGVTPKKMQVCLPPRARTSTAPVCQDDNQGQGEMPVNTKGAQEDIGAVRRIIERDEDRQPVEEQDDHNATPTSQMLSEPTSTLPPSLKEKEVPPLRPNGVLVPMSVAVISNASGVEQGSVPVAPDLATQRLEAALRLLELEEIEQGRHGPGFLRVRSELVDVIPPFSSGADIMSWARAEKARADKNKIG